MTLTKAIDIVAQAIRDNHDNLDPDTLDALNLALSAMLRLDLLRTRVYTLAQRPLDGEDPPIHLHTPHPRNPLKRPF